MAGPVSVTTEWSRRHAECQQLEKEQGLTRDPDLDWTASRHPHRREVGKAERTGRGEPARAELRRVVSPGSGGRRVTNCTGWAGLSLL
jgi:hypothetical protein